MAYRFIEEHQEEFGISWMLNKMGICPNANYNYLKHAKKNYHVRKKEVCLEIKNLYH